jgi:deoxyribose-phosphate aldolase
MSESIARLIDHTLLKADATGADVQRLCQEALQYSFCAVCVHGWYVPFCVEQLSGSKVLVCTTVGFPLGATSADVKVFETQAYLDNGAQEIDMVINLAAFLSGEQKIVADEIQEVAELCHSQNVPLKVIIETSLLKTDENKAAACRIAKEAGADFVKTSTGYAGGGATVEDVALMRRTVGDVMGVKASGGIKDYQTARAMLQAGASRIGTSSGVAIIKAETATS